MSSRLFLSVREELGLAYDVSSGLVDYADAGALEVSAGVDPASLPAALDAILVELARLRDELVPDAELEKAKRYLSGGLELRMDDTRHVASWIGGQEALHDRVLTLDEALAAVQAVDAAGRPAPRRAALPRRRPAAGGRRARALPARARGPPAVAGMTTHTAPDRTTPPARSAELLLAHAHLRLGSLALARTELETLAGMGKLDSLGLVDLAEVRWRTGDLAGAGEAAAVALRGDEEHAGRPADRGRGGGLARSPERIAPARGAGDGQRDRLDRCDLRRHAAFGGVAARCRRAATDRADAVRSGL